MVRWAVKSVQNENVWGPPRREEGPRDEGRSKRQVSFRRIPFLERRLAHNLYRVKMALEYKRVRIRRFAQQEERETTECACLQAPPAGGPFPCAHVAHVPSPCSPLLAQVQAACHPQAGACAFVRLTFANSKAPDRAHRTTHTSFLQPAAVTCIDFSQQAPHDFAVTSGTRIVVYDGSSGKEKRALTKFKDTVFSAVWRRDGRMLVCGNARGVVQAIQPSTRTVLRSCHGHSAAVHTTRFSSDGAALLSGGDDAGVRMWDMATGEALGVLEGAHGDYIRASAVGGESSPLAGVWATGSYDHTVRLWDGRTFGRGGEDRPLKRGSASTGAVVTEDLGPAEGEDEEEGLDEEGEELDEGEGDEPEEGGAADEERDDSDDDEEEEEDGSSVSDEVAGAAEATLVAGSGRGPAPGSGQWEGGGTKRPRGTGCILSVDHGEPVTSVTLLPGGGTLVTTGSNTVKVWDILGAGCRLLATVAAHAKLVTGAALDASGGRLLTSGLDGLVKVHELASFTAMHTLRFGVPLLAVGLSPDRTRLVAGASDGGAHVRCRSVGLGEAVREKKEAAVLRGGTYRYFLRGANARSSIGDGEGGGGGGDRKPRLRPYDVLLKGFAHGAALDAALDGGDPLVVASLLEELQARRALGAALAGRAPASAAHIVRWAGEYIGHPRYAALCADVALASADAFASGLGGDADLDAAFGRLAARTGDETRLQVSLLGLQGCLDMLMAASAGGGGGQYL
jgi:hypothetical protein